MYLFLGGDQREYGPVTADQIREWIAEGRANGETRVKAEGGGDWSALSDLPEFAEALTSQAARLVTPALNTPAADPTLLADCYAERAAHLDIVSCLERSWRLLQQHFGLLVGSSATVLVISVVLEFIPLLGAVANTIFGLVLWGGLDWVFLRLVRGQRAEFADTFAGFRSAFVPLMLAGIVTTVLIFLGLLLCILPGIYLIVAWLGFSPLLIMDKQMEFWPALELSRKVVTRNWWIIFGLLILTAVIFLAGAVALVIGLFVTLPLATGAIVYAYEDIFGAAPPPAT